MKISADTLSALTELIAPYDTPEKRARYLAGNFPRAAETKDINVRYRWDLFWAAKARELITSEHTTAHIDTALRRIVLPL